jgi:hypothetical protein
MSEDLKYPEHRHRHDHHHAKHDEVVLDIATPKGLFKAAFPKTTKVSTVIEVVVTEKHLDTKDQFELVHGETVLKPESRALEGFGLHGEVQLELVATGSGV